MTQQAPIKTVTETAFVKARELDAIFAFIKSKSSTECNIPVASYGILNTYQIEMCNHASFIIGYIEQLQEEIKQLKATPVI